MQNSPAKNLSRFLTDRFSSEWKLLTETERYLSNTPEAPLYESRFRLWREKLNRISRGSTELISLRSEIVDLRKELRLKGYDLSLGLQTLVLEGFRDDTAMAEGFSRVVLCFTNVGLFFHTGSANHIALAQEMDIRLHTLKGITSRESHYLWYARTAQGLILSGGATETKESFLRLEALVTANPLKLLSALKDLR
ncbi:MAG: hypothetical protein JW875_09625 [Spirochaetales bacterium]|nr:hypothetical protein [Spirochaetales bacterium]